MIVGSVSSEVYRRIEDYVRKATGAEASPRPTSTETVAAFIASQIGGDPKAFEEYARRDETRHIQTSPARSRLIAANGGHRLAPGARPAQNSFLRVCPLFMRPMGLC